ncbi:hypothetical protein A0H81_10529 [Grifola frondosa]|uniref:Uncharacterized protein n=1 Tax=Grifola frondosa TaxID=5627 RepID=A0A1C7M042_GRIFR|nr:hypothetical protein A0H81_10529 [Grifola frondosa]
MRLQQGQDVMDKDRVSGPAKGTRVVAKLYMCRPLQREPASACDLAFRYAAFLGHGKLILIYDNLEPLSASSVISTRIRMSVSLVPNIAQIFNPKSQSGTVETIAGVIKNFKDKAERRADGDDTQHYLTIKLAPSFGTLDASSIKDLDEELKVMIAGTHRALADIPPQQRTFDKVVEICLKNAVLEMDTNPSFCVDKTDYMTKADTDYFKLARRKDKRVVEEVHAWFTKLISDADIIDIGVFSEIVATTGAAVEHLEHIIKKNEKLEKSVVDVGVLRYPDIENPYFKVYRIQLKAWRDTTRILVVGKHANGITGTCNIRRFKPRQIVIDRLKPETVNKASHLNTIFLLSLITHLVRTTPGCGRSRGYVRLIICVQVPDVFPLVRGATE